MKNDNSTNSDITSPVLTLAKLQSAVDSLKKGEIGIYFGVDVYETKPPIVCVMCGNSELCHFTDPTHPLFKDNLEMLEWKATEKENER